MTKEEILATKPSIDGKMNDLLFEYTDVIEAMGEYASALQSENERLKAEREWISPEVADKIIRARDAIVEDDYTEAYHQLCLIADPTLCNLNHWKRLERIADNLQTP